MNIGVIMDPPANITPHKDSTVALMREGQARGHRLFSIQISDLFCQNSTVFARAAPILVDETKTPWFSIGTPQKQRLSDFDVVFMRKDPPFDMPYLFITYLLELAEKEGAWIINSASGLRNSNEKLFTQWFPHLTPPTLITSNKTQLQSFIDTHQDVVLKPLNEMGGRSIFHMTQESDNRSVVLDWLTKEGTLPIMAQRFLPDILETGDRRITVIAGKPVPYALSRMPVKGDFRGNLAAGGIGAGSPLNSRDLEICAEVGPALMERGLIWAGLDIIGGYLTEINVTSPTGIRELDRQFNLNISGQLWDWVETSHRDAL